eukprot:9140633-Heterocapsa_arctica.AAC.1
MGRALRPAPHPVETEKARTQSLLEACSSRRRTMATTQRATWLGGGPRSRSPVDRRGVNRLAGRRRPFTRTFL